MLKKIEHFFRLHSYRNWWAPYHFIIASILTSLFVRLFGVSHPDMFIFRLYTAIGFVIATGYELWQMKYQKQSRREALEDMAFNIAGYFVGVIHLI